jgi:hypothetical protein
MARYFDRRPNLAIVSVARRALFTKTKQCYRDEGFQIKKQISKIL